MSFLLFNPDMMKSAKPYNIDQYHCTCNVINNTIPCHVFVRTRARR